MVFVLSGSQMTSDQKSKSRHNKSLISHKEVKTEVGYMPLLNAPIDSYGMLLMFARHVVSGAQTGIPPTTFSNVCFLTSPDKHLTFI